MATFEIGRSVPRTEDDRLLRGAGRFVGDINLDEQVMGYILRSPHAHANILGIDCAQAKRAAGVLGVVTAGDIDGKVGDLPCLLPVESRVGLCLESGGNWFWRLSERVEFCGGQAARSRVSSAIS